MAALTLTPLQHGGNVETTGTQDSISRRVDYLVAGIHPLRDSVLGHPPTPSKLL